MNFPIFIRIVHSVH